MAAVQVAKGVPAELCCKAGVPSTLRAFSQALSVPPLSDSGLYMGGHEALLHSAELGITHVLVRPRAGAHFFA